MVVGGGCVGLGLLCWAMCAVVVMGWAVSVDGLRVGAARAWGDGLRAALDDRERAAADAARVGSDWGTDAQRAGTALGAADAKLARVAAVVAEDASAVAPAPFMSLGLGLGSAFAGWGLGAIGGALLAWYWPRPERAGAQKGISASGPAAGGASGSTSAAAAAAAS